MDGTIMNCNFRLRIQVILIEVATYRRQSPTGRVPLAAVSGGL